MFTEENTNGNYVKEDLQIMNEFLILCMDLNKVHEGNYTLDEIEEYKQYYSEKILNLV